MVKKYAFKPSHISRGCLLYVYYVNKLISTLRHKYISGGEVDDYFYIIPIDILKDL